MIRIENLVQHYDIHPILRNIPIAIRKEALVAIIDTERDGENGVVGRWFVGGLQ